MSNTFGSAVRASAPEWNGRPESADGWDRAVPVASSVVYRRTGGQPGHQGEAVGWGGVPSAYRTPGECTPWGTAYYDDADPNGALHDDVPARGPAYAHSRRSASSARQPSHVLTCADCLHLATTNIHTVTLLCAGLLAAVRGVWMVATARVSVDTTSQWSFVVLLEWQLLADLVLAVVGMVALVAVRATSTHYERDAARQGRWPASDATDVPMDTLDKHRASMSLLAQQTASQPNVSNELPVLRSQHREEEEEEKHGDPAGEFRPLADQLYAEWVTLVHAMPFALLMASCNALYNAASYLALMTLSPSAVQATVEACVLFSSVVHVAWGGMGPSMLGAVSALVAVMAAAQASNFPDHLGSGIALLMAMYASLARALFVVAQRATVSVIVYGSSRCCGRPPITRPILLHGTGVLRATVLSALTSVLVTSTLWCGLMIGQWESGYVIPHLPWNVWTLLGAMAQIATPVGRLLTDYSGQPWLSLCASVLTVFTVDVLSILVLDASASYDMWASTGLLMLAAVIRSYDALSHEVAATRSHGTG